MAKLPRYGPPDGDADRREYGAIVAQAFAGDSETFEGWLRGFGDDIRVIRDGRAIRAGLVFYDMGQFFGGREVPTWGVAGVAVRPEMRSQGLARELMQAHLAENFESGPPIATLYPATPKLYRNLGWEFAGSRCTYSLRLADLPVPESPLVIRPVVAADDGLVAELYARRHARENGCLARDAKIWQRVRRTPKENPLCGYIAERDGQAEGYILYMQRRESADTFRFNILCRDVVCLTADAARAFVAFFARHRSVANQLHFFAAPGDPLLMLALPNSEVQVQQRLDWMLRIVRVKDALEARGYPAIRAEASVTVVDDVLANDGGWKLALDDGRMHASPGGKGGAKINIRGLAALYSGFMGPAQLRVAGLLTGPAKHDDALGAMFAGTAPWMPDFF